MDDFTCLVLCGGLGTRLLPLTENHQKCMLNVQELPFLAYIDYQIHNFGINKIVFCCSHKSEEIIRYFGTYNGFTYKYSSPIEFLNTGARIIKALPFVSTKNIIIFNGDSYCNINTETFWKLYNRFDKSDSLICKLLVNKNNSLLSSFIGNEENYFGAGIYFLRTELIKNLEYFDHLSLEDDIIIPNFDKTMYIRLPDNFFVVDIGTHKNFETINNKESKYGRFFANLNSWIADKATAVLP